MRIGTRAGSVVLGLLMAVAPAGCTLQFPQAGQSHRFPCSSGKDCQPGFVCGADGKCDAADGGGGGHTGPDGGVTADGGDGGMLADGGDGGTLADGGDGGTPDGGVACSGHLAVSPGVLDLTLLGTATETLSLYPSTSASSSGPTGKVTIDGQPAGYARCAETTHASGTSDPVAEVCTVSAKVTKVGTLTTGSATVRLDIQGTGCFEGSAYLAAEDPGASVTVSSPAGVTPAIAGTASAGVRPRIFVTLSPMPALTAQTPVQVYVYDRTMGALTALADPLPITSGTDGVEASIPSIVMSGTYPVVVAIGHAVARGGTLTVVDASQTPSLQSVTPDRVKATGNATKLILHGDNLDVGTPSISVVCGSLKAITANTVGTPSTAARTISVALPKGAAGDHCHVVYDSTGTQNPFPEAQVGGLLAYDPASQSPPAWQQTTGALVTPRTDAGAAVATLLDGRRYLVVVGGQDASGPITSGFSEIAPIDEKGDLGKFSAGPDLIGPNQQAIGLVLPAVAANANMIYVAGGSAGGTPQSAVYRADVLVPGQRITGVGADYLLAGTGGQLTAGSVRYYAVTAKITPTPIPAIKTPDPLDQTPATVPLGVRVPSGVEGILIHWDLITRPDRPVAKYEVYEGPTPTDLARIGTVDATRRAFTDTGAASSGQVHPPEVGDLSAWLALPTAYFLQKARVGATAAVVPGGPSTSAAVVVAGGEGLSNGSTTALDTMEWGWVATRGRATFDGFTGTVTLSKARRHLQARVIPEGYSDGTAPSGPYLLLGPGSDGQGAAVPWVGVWKRGGSTIKGVQVALASGTLDPDPFLFLGPGSATTLDASTGGGTGAGEYAATLDATATPPAAGATYTDDGASSPWAKGQASAEDEGDCYLVGGTPSGKPTGVVWHAVR